MVSLVKQHFMTAIAGYEPAVLFDVESYQFPSVGLLWSRRVTRSATLSRPRPRPHRPHRLKTLVARGEDGVLRQCILHGVRVIVSNAIHYA